MPDPAAAEAFYAAAFDLGDQVSVRAADSADDRLPRVHAVARRVPAGHRGQPRRHRPRRGRHDAEAGGEELLGLRRRRPGPGRRDLEGRDVVEEGPGPGDPEIDDIVLLLGVADVKATKQFYVDAVWTWGRASAASTSSSTPPSSQVKLALYGRRALAKDAGVPPEGTGSHRIAIVSDAGPFTDPDGFEWEAASA